MGDRAVERLRAQIVAGSGLPAVYFGDTFFFRFPFPALVERSAPWR